MSWETVKLGDIAEFSNGVNFDKSAYSKGVKLIGVSDFGNRFSPDYASLDEIKKEVVRPTDYLLDGDMVFVRSNGNKELVGRCMLINKPTSLVTYSGFCIRTRLKDTSKYNPLFFTFLFKSVAFRKALTGTAIGANIQNLSQGRLSSCTVQVPDFKTQQNIADILYSYQSLIENNKKQIKLLEEAAQRLYKEWFVDLCFPGHETTPIIDGIPQGWRKDFVGNIIDKSYRSKQVMTADYLAEGKIPIIDQSRDFIAGYTDDEETLVSLDKPIIVFGDHTRILKYIQFPFAKGADGTQLVVSKCENVPQALLYLSLLNVDLSNYHYARHFKYLKAEEIIIPTIEIATKFDYLVSPIFKKVQILRDQTINAQQARDRLLPKLMSGELEV